MTISGKTKLYGLVGRPAGHTLSPFIMNRAFAEFGIDAVYVAFDPDSEGFPVALRGLRALGIAGVNITYPYKQRVLDCVDRRSSTVDIVGAANTLCLSPHGTEAHNTDAPGTARALDLLGSAPPAGKTALVLGAGGAGRAAAFGLLQAGAVCVTFAVRTPSKHQPVVERFRRAFADRRVDSVPFSVERERLARLVADADIIINATPNGMSGLDSDVKDDRPLFRFSPDNRASHVRSPSSAGDAILEESWIDPRQCCFDFVYHPRATDFLACAARRGARPLDGLALLVAQAQAAFRLWTGKEFSLERMYSDAAVEYSRRNS